MRAVICGVYIIRNTLDGKRYVGQSRDCLHRFQQHRNGLRNGNHRNAYLQNAWKVHGEAAFTFAVACVCMESQLDELETRFMSEYGALDRARGYNMEGVVFGAKRRDATTVAKLRAANLGKTLSAEHRAKLSVSRRLRAPYSEETKAKISASRKLYKLTPEQKARIGASNKGKRRTAEQRAALSAAHKGFRPTDETRDKLRATNAAAREVRAAETAVYASIAKKRGKIC